MNLYTPGPWSQGRVLTTRATQSWPAEMLREHQKLESRMVFSNFTSRDQGRSRNLIAVCTNEWDAQITSAAPDMLAALKAVFQPGGWTHSEDCLCEVCRMVRHAIAKAESRL